MVSCQKGPTRHAYAWQIGPFWQDTLDILWTCPSLFQMALLLLYPVCDILLTCHSQWVYHVLCNTMWTCPSSRYAHYRILYIISSGPVLHKCYSYYMLYVMLNESAISHPNILISGPSPATPWTYNSHPMLNMLLIIYSSNVKYTCPYLMRMLVTSSCMLSKVDFLFRSSRDI